MKKRLLVTIAMLLMSTFVLAYGINLAAASTGYIDEFNSTTLSGFWTTSGNAGATYDLTSNPGFLRITSPAGCDLGGSNNDAPRILQQVTGDFIAFTLVSGAFDSSHAGVHAGLLVYVDDNHFMRVERRDTGIVQMGGENGGSFVYAQQAVGSMNPTYLELAKAGTTISGYWSSDGSIWNLFGQFTFSSPDPVNVGLFVINQNTGVPSFYADFDYFHITPGSTYVNPLPEYPLGTILAQ